MASGAAGGSRRVRLLTRPLKVRRFWPSWFLRFLMGLPRLDSSEFGSVHMEQREEVNTTHSSDLADWRARRVARRILHLLKASFLCVCVAARRLSGSSHTGKIFRSAPLTLFSLDRANTIDINTKYYSSHWKVRALDHPHSFHWKGFYKREKTR